MSLRLFAKYLRRFLVSSAVFLSLSRLAFGDNEWSIEEVEGQPLGANLLRIVDSMELLGRPMPAETVKQLLKAANERDAEKLQTIVDPLALFLVEINPESRVKVRRSSHRATLQQSGYTPCLVKVVNQATITKRLQIVSPQAGPVFGGVAKLSMQRQQQEHLLVNQNDKLRGDRFLDVEMFRAPPLTESLSGLRVEYVVALIYCAESGIREATIGFDVDQGNQDLGFRGEVPVLMDIRPAIPVTLQVIDFDGKPTMGRFLFRDAHGHVYPPQPKRLSPDLFFQPHIYRAHGEIVELPPGKFTVEYGRGPEYRVERQSIEVGSEPLDVRFDLHRWANPARFGYVSGDHHIHAAGCAHYTSPTEGVTPEAMFRQVKGQAINVGCVLTWGPCYDFQRQFFAPEALDISEPDTLLKYDLEISGFGSQALGHVCLLNLKDQTYPGSDGTSTKGWPTWTTPVMRWAKQQGGYTGYAHSASGLKIEPASVVRWWLERVDDDDNFLSQEEATQVLLPESFTTIDTDFDGKLSRRELEMSHARAAEQLPNYAIPEMNGVGAMEICVSTAEGVCDFISAMDTARIQEWNTWYHILNCGFPLKVSGETDFPCMSSQEVGTGRVYVQMPPRQGNERIDFAAWCDGLAKGRSYVSDGYAHAYDFRVNGVKAGDGIVQSELATSVSVDTQVSFAAEQPLNVAQGGIIPGAGRSVVGDTVLLHGERSSAIQTGGVRKVELIVNGRVSASVEVPADGKVHDVNFDLQVDQSSWVALRQFPQMHTNPVNVIIASKPIRASKMSALWCGAMMERLWQNRQRNIAANERSDAENAFARAKLRYLAIAGEATDDRWESLDK